VAEEDNSLPPQDSGEETGEETMESLLAEQASLQEKIKKREVIWVKVVQVQNEHVLVDIGEKNEGLIPSAEFPKDKIPQIGRRVPAIVVKLGRSESATVLSYEKAKATLGWDQLVQAKKEKARVRGKVISAVKGGFMVEVQGVRGFMPSSLADLRPVRKPQAMVGTGVRCYIIELNRVKNQFILSRRAVLEEDSKKRVEKVYSSLKPGMVRIARINRINESGFIVDIGGLDGLVRTADITWNDPQKAKMRFSRGQKVRARVLKMEPDGHKVWLGLKQLTPHPADQLRKKYQVKKTVRGKVTAILKDGVKIKLAQGDPAFCPVRDLPQAGGKPAHEKNKRDDVKDVLWPKEGDAVTAIVTGILNQSFEVGVSIRKYETMQDRKRVQQYMKEAPKLTLGQLLKPDSE